MEILELAPRLATLAVEYDAFPYQPDDLLKGNFITQREHSILVNYHNLCSEAFTASQAAEEAVSIPMRVYPKAYQELLDNSQKLDKLLAPYRAALTGLKKFDPYFGSTQWRANRLSYEEFQRVQFYLKTLSDNSTFTDLCDLETANTKAMEHRTRSSNSLVKAINADWYTTYRTAQVAAGKAANLAFIDAHQDGWDEGEAVNADIEERKAHWQRRVLAKIKALILNGPPLPDDAEEQGAEAERLFIASAHGVEVTA